MGRLISQTVIIFRYETTIYVGLNLNPGRELDSSIVNGLRPVGPLLRIELGLFNCIYCKWTLVPVRPVDSLAHVLVLV